MSEEIRPTKEQQAILDSQAKKLVISASAGSGKTSTLIKKLIDLICEKKVPVERLLVLTFTKAASKEIKSRLTSEILSRKSSPELIEALDSLPLSDICTIDSFCEKIIKRNISSLDLNENFSILDEKNSSKLKKNAFSSAYQQFAEQNPELFEEVYLAFMKDKERMEKCCHYIEDYIASQENDEKEKYIGNLLKYNEDAEKFLIDIIKDALNRGKLVVGFYNPAELTESEKRNFAVAEEMLNISTEGDIFDIAQRFNAFEMPALKGNHKLNVKSTFSRMKEELNKIKAITENYLFLPPQTKDKLSSGILVKAILGLYKLYKENYERLKSRRSNLDFADIERYAQKLLENEEVKKSLQEKYDYVFIDEYQDTNKLQASILKPIAEGGHFVGIGDIKQGIYGFRNASMDIMLEDMENFSNMTDGQSLSLNGNFRTDGGILSFVNDIFDKIMTKESVGIDYAQNSRLEAKKEFLPDNNPSVKVDIVLKNKDKGEILSGVYSVKEDTLKGDDKLENEVNTIISEIENYLLSEIYDSKLKKKRNVEASDIALLFRERSPLMQEVAKKLQSLGLSVIADLKEPLISDSQISLLISLLKLSLNMEDDVSLVSVMCSLFGKFSTDEMANLRLQNDQKTFYQIVAESEDEKICQLKTFINNFKFDIQVFGVIKAFCRLFNKYNYYDYLLSFNDGREKIGKINTLFKVISSCGLDYDVAGIISTIESSSENSGGEGGGDAITLTTIHATKGLEYPIVILCECGESLKKAYRNSYLLSKDFGLGCKLNDFENMTVLPSPSFVAGKIKLAKREFIDEMMIFYVALTRAQNHLCIIGQGEEKDFTFKNLNDQNSYLKLIMFALGENFTSQLFSQNEIKTENRQFAIIDQTLEQNDKKEEQVFQKKNSDFEEEIEKYNSYIYNGKELCKINYKNSVTGTLALAEEEKELEDFSNRVSSKDEAINRGNAYHEALKIIDFDKINGLEDFDKINLKEMMSEDYYNLLDLNILLKNILLLKEVTKGTKLFKEKEFIMKSDPQEIGLTDNNLGENSLIVQGIIDLFASGEKLILIDYKFSSLTDEKALLNRYEKQLDLYSLALSKSFGKEVDEIYLLSLKNAKLIKKT